MDANTKIASLLPIQYTRFCVQNSNTFKFSLKVRVIIVDPTTGRKRRASTIYDRIKPIVRVVDLEKEVLGVHGFDAARIRLLLKSKRSSNYFNLLITFIFLRKKKCSQLSNYVPFIKNSLNEKCIVLCSIFSNIFYQYLSNIE